MTEHAKEKDQKRNLSESYLTSNALIVYSINPYWPIWDDKDMKQLPRLVWIYGYLIEKQLL